MELSRRKCLLWEGRPWNSKALPSRCESGDLLLPFAVSVMARIGVKCLTLGAAGSVIPRPAGSCLSGADGYQHRAQKQWPEGCGIRARRLSASPAEGSRAAGRAMRARVAVAAPSASPRPPWRPCRQGALRRRAAPRGGGGRGRGRHCVAMSCRSPCGGGGSGRTGRRSCACLPPDSCLFPGSCCLPRGLDCPSSGLVALAGRRG